MVNTYEEGKSYSMNSIEVMKFQPNKYPFLLIDHVDEVIPGKSAKGYKNLTLNEWFFPIHFEASPSMPGALQIEALSQMLSMTFLTLPGLKGKEMNGVSIDNVRLKRKVLPGERLDIITELKSFKRGMAVGSGKGLVGDNLCISADFKIIIPHIFYKYMK
jgi:3-hydroxyacyl-[acyl-carrier-protein] dehydratase